MIEYRDHVDGLESEHLQGFFEGWPSPPDPQTHLELLRSSDAIVLAVETETSQVIGFVTAITDGVLAAYVPLLEVRPEQRGKGIGSELVRRIVARMEHLYMIDLVCDEELVPFYERHGLRSMRAVGMRNFENQSGAHREAGRRERFE